MWARWLNYLKSPACLAPRAVLVVLMFVHDKTAYHVARTIPELFYWPEGLCWDMLVLGLFFVAMVACIFFDVRFLIYNHRESEKEYADDWND